jgi:hypothetical protein
MPNLTGDRRHGEHCEGVEETLCLFCYWRFLVSLARIPTHPVWRGTYVAAACRATYPDVPFLFFVRADVASKPPSLEASPNDQSFATNLPLLDAEGCKRDFDGSRLGYMEFPLTFKIQRHTNQ